MNPERVEKIAEAVLYEGYMLYPYRASAVKNQQRWNFGVLCPRSYSESQHGTEAWTMQTECLLQADSSALLNVKVRFLQIVERTIGKLTRPLRELPPDSEPEHEVVDRLEVGGQTYLPWQEAAERETSAPPVNASAAILYQPMLFDFPQGRELEPLRNEDGLIEGVIIREWKQLSGSIEIDLKQCRPVASKGRVTIHNLTLYGSRREESRADALMYSMVSTHTILAIANGRFISLLDPPEDLRGMVDECRNIGTWPVLVGDEGDCDTMLSSPIILYDYPQIAPQSVGSLFDGTEIDEILSLRILTMTEAEKSEMRQSDQHARQILERTENMPPEQFMRLHGVMRALHPLAKEAS